MTSCKMCQHRQYIFISCGHSCLDKQPLVMCRHASISPMSTYSSACELKTHPFQSRKIESLCWPCQRRRSELLERLETQHIVRFNEAQCKVSYSAPPQGMLGEKDAIDRHMEKQVEKKAVKMEKSTKSGRLSFKNRK
jgi:hypothetical protein